MVRFISLIFLSILITACNQSQSLKVEDSTVAAPDHYKVEFENEYVRVVRVTYNPGEQSSIHSHRPLVGVTLTGGQGVFTDIQGNKETRPENFAGDVLADNGETHSVLSISKGPEELVFVEVKKSYPASADPLDFVNAINVSSINATVELEEHGIRVIRIKGEPGLETPMHSHRAGITLPLTDINISHTNADGEVGIINNKAGTISWAEPRSHKGKNLSDKSNEVILFELM
jgi:quercetin dioxygenase-like cupin family protein